jgi:hypothetical protein
MSVLDENVHFATASRTLPSHHQKISVADDPRGKLGEGTTFWKVMLRFILDGEGSKDHFFASFLQGRKPTTL